MEPSFRASYGNVNRWFTTVVNQPQFKNVVGNVVLCEKMAKFDGKYYLHLPRNNLVSHLEKYTMIMRG